MRNKFLISLSLFMLFAFFFGWQETAESKKILSINVFDKGATGDGIADDKSAIQSAINEIYKKGGGTVYLPAGKYNIRSSVTLKSNVTLKGHGKDSLIIVNGNWQGVLFSGSERDPCVSTRITGLTFQGSNNTKNKRNSLIYAPASQYVSSCSVDHCYFYQSGNDAIVFEGNSSNIFVLNNFVDGTGDDGINIAGSGKTITRAYVNNNYVTNATNDGIHLSRGSEGVICTNNTILKCATGIGIYSSSKHIINGNRILSCGTGIESKHKPTADINITNNFISVTTTGRGISLRHNPLRSVVIGNQLQKINHGKSNGIEIVKGENSIIAANSIDTAKECFRIKARKYSAYANTFRNCQTPSN